MTKDEALRKLRDLENADDPESAHAQADKILLELINDPEVEAAFESIECWYA